jgi:hypothetical protein
MELKNIEFLLQTRVFNMTRQNCYTEGVQKMCMWYEMWITVIGIWYRSIASDNLSMIGYWTDHFL